MRQVIHNSYTHDVTPHPWSIFKTLGHLEISWSKGMQWWNYKPYVAFHICWNNIRINKLRFSRIRVFRLIHKAGWKTVVTHATKDQVNDMRQGLERSGGILRVRGCNTTHQETFLRQPSCRLILGRSMRTLQVIAAGWSEPDEFGISSKSTVSQMWHGRRSWSKSCPTFLSCSKLARIYAVPFVAVKCNASCPSTLFWMCYRFRQPRLCTQFLMPSLSSQKLYLPNG